MQNGERAFVIADWIFVVGIMPFAYLIAYMLFVNILNSLFINIPAFYELQHSNLFILFIILIASIGFVITLFYVITNKIKKNKKTKPMKKITDKFLFGVFLIYIGHLGLVIIYILLLYIQFSPGGRASGLFAAPAIPWMFIFYSIGYSIVNKQKLLEMSSEKNGLESHT